ncbi:hypothetical protein ACS0TY_027515 [Phlomoides rotata]
MSRAYSLLLLLSLLALFIIPQSMARVVEEDSSLSNSNISETEDQIFEEEERLWTIEDSYNEHYGDHTHPPKHHGHHAHPPKHHGHHAHPPKHHDHHAHPPKHHGRHRAPPPKEF